MKKKFKAFVSQLSDDEINEQLENIFEWAKLYKDLLEEEKRKRRNSPIGSVYIGKLGFDDYEPDFDEFEDEENVEEYVEEYVELSQTIDFNLAQVIHQKVSLLSEDETKERLAKLKSVYTGNLSNEEKAQLLYEIEECELHLFDFTEDNENIVCSRCGNVIDENAKFCGVCGNKITM